MLIPFSLDGPVLRTKEKKGKGGGKGSNGGNGKKGGKSQANGQELKSEEDGFMADLRKSLMGGDDGLTTQEAAELLINNMDQTHNAAEFLNN